MAPHTIQQAFDLALQRHQAGRLQEAEQLYRQVLARHPAHADAMHLLGVIAHQMGRNDVAVDLMRQAIAINPNLAEAYNNLGTALKTDGRLDEAIAAYRRAVAINPTLPQAHMNLGMALMEKGQIDQAIAAYRQAIALNPNLPGAYGNLGKALRDSGQLDQAIAAYRQAIALSPDFVEAHVHLGNTFKDKDQLNEAIAAYRQAIALRPDYAEVHSNLGSALKENRQFDEAIAAYRRAIALKPDYAEAYNNLGNALRDKGQPAEALVAYRKAVSLNPSFPVAHCNLVYSLYYHPDYDTQAILAEHRRLAQVHAEPLRPEIRPHHNDRSPDRRLRIGYVSPDFRDHVLGWNIFPLLSNHDHRQFEIFLYSSVTHPDQTTQRLRDQADVWRNIASAGDAAAADLIRSDRIDLLVDSTLLTARNRLLLFARQPAPVQLTMLGPPITTGLPTMHYRLTDPYLDPPGVGDEQYTETSIRLPDCFWIYQPPPWDVTPNELPARTNGFVTFGCLNQFAKVTPSVLELWRQILQSVPNSRLMIHSPRGDHLEGLNKAFERGGISLDRVRWVAGTTREGYFRRYHELDICLDPFPYNGHTTSMDALWMGVPIVTMRGRTVVGRGGVSLLSNVGLTDWIAGDPDEYVSIARQMAADPPKLAELRSTLRNRMEQSPLMDGPRFARNVEAAYRQMWRTWCGA